MSRSKLRRKAPFYFAAVWALGVSLYILLAPHGTSVGTTITSDGQEISQTVSHPSFYEVQGWEGIAALAVFASLYLLVAAAAWFGRTLPLAVASLMASLLTFLAGFSIGLFYFPAMFAVFLGWLAMGFGKLASSRPQDSTSSGS
jgi:hypothetical protein